MSRFLHTSDYQNRLARTKGFTGWPCWRAEELQRTQFRIQTQCPNPSPALLQHKMLYPASPYGVKISFLKRDEVLTHIHPPLLEAFNSGSEVKHLTAAISPPRVPPQSMERNRNSPEGNLGLR